MIALADKVARRDDAAAEDLQDELVIVDLRTGDYFNTGRVGAFIWERLDGRELDQIAREISRTFDIESESASADLLAFVEQLIANGLAHRVTGP